jgi:hypothetical protein
MYKQRSQVDDNALYHEGIHSTPCEIFLYCKRLIENLKERNHFEGLGTEVKITLKFILKKEYARDMDWIRLAQVWDQWRGSCT